MSLEFPGFHPGLSVAAPYGLSNGLLLRKSLGTGHLRAALRRSGLAGQASFEDHSVRVPVADAELLAGGSG